MLSKEGALGILRSCGAYLEPDDRHFELADGAHSGVYIDSDAFLPSRRITECFVTEIVMDLTNAGVLGKIDVVCGPAKAGITVALRVADMITHVRNSEEIPHIYSSEVTNKRHILRYPHAALVSGKQVLVVEDVMMYANATRGCINAVRAAGGSVIAVAPLINRGVVTADSLGVPLLVSAASIELPGYPKDMCQAYWACSKGIQLDSQRGRGAEKSRLHDSMTHHIH